MTMGTFNAKISAEFTPPKTWKLEKELSCEERLDDPAASDVSE